MITLKANDIVFLEDIGVHARVQEVRLGRAPLPPVTKCTDEYGYVIKSYGQAERPEVVVTLVQVDVQKGGAN